MADSKVPAIYGAIEAIQASVGKIPKNGHMDFGKTQYDFVRNDDILEKVQEQLVANHVIVKPEILEYNVDNREIGAGRVIPLVVIKLRQTYISTVDGSEHTIEVYGEGSGTDDKGLRKAVTIGQKIANLLTFSISTGEPDPDGIPASEHAPAPAQNRTQTSIQNAGEAALSAARTAVKVAAGAKGLASADLNAMGLQIDSDFYNKTPALIELKKRIDAIEVA